LARVLGADLLPEAFDRLLPHPSLSFSGPAELERLERRLLREEVDRFRIAERARRQGRTVVLDTGFLGPLTYTAVLARNDERYRPVLERVAREVEQLVRAGSLGVPSIVLYLDLDERSVARRAARAPRSHPIEWRERHRAVAAGERRLWTREYPGILPGRLGVVRASGPPVGVVARLLPRLSRLRGEPPVTLPRTLRVVRAFAGLPIPPSPARPARPRPAPRSRDRESLRTRPGLAGPP
jgi:hypothetical protein